jgi:Family of unknown function (DUF6941)
VNLGFLLLADYSEAINGKIYAMGGGWNVLRFPRLPHEWGFALALGVDVPWDETNQTYSLSMHVEDPDGELLGDEFSMDFEAGRPPGSIQGSDQRIVVSLQTRATFSAAGPHAVVIKIEDAEIGRSRFYVVQVPQQTGPPQTLSPEDQPPT